MPRNSRPSHLNTGLGWGDKSWADVEIAQNNWDLLNTMEKINQKQIDLEKKLDSQQSNNSNDFYYEMYLNHEIEKECNRQIDNIIRDCNSYKLPFQKVANINNFIKYLSNDTKEINDMKRKLDNLNMYAHHRKLESMIYDYRVVSITLFMLEMVVVGGIWICGLGKLDLLSFILTVICAIKLYLDTTVRLVPKLNKDLEKDGLSLNSDFKAEYNKCKEQLQILKETPNEQFLDFRLRNYNSKFEKIISENRRIFRDIWDAKVYAAECGIKDKGYTDFKKHIKYIEELEKQYQEAVKENSNI